MEDGYAGLSWGFPRGFYLFWVVLRLSGVLSGLSLGSLGLSWPLLGLSLAALSVLSWLLLVFVRRLLGVFWGCLGLSWAPCGPPFLGPLSQEAARQQESGPRECNEPPKRLPSEPKLSPNKLLFRLFFGASFRTLFGTPLRRVSWTLGLSRTRISLGRSYKMLLPPGRLQERKITDKLAKTGPKIEPTKLRKKRVQQKGSTIKRKLPPGPPQGSAECDPKIRDPPAYGEISAPGGGI